MFRREFLRGLVGAVALTVAPIWSPGSGEPCPVAEVEPVEEIFRDVFRCGFSWSGPKMVFISDREIWEASHGSSAEGS